MKISTIPDHIDSGHMALPEFQRGYVRNRDQVRAAPVFRCVDSVEGNPFAVFTGPSHPGHAAPASIFY